MKYDYKTVDFQTPACTGMEQTLKKLGKEGWELVSVCPTCKTGPCLETVTAFLKKEIK